MATKRIQIIGRIPPDETKQNKLAWVTDADIEAMIAGTYVGEEDESPEAAYAPKEYQIADTTTGDVYRLYVQNGDLKMEVAE